MRAFVEQEPETSTTIPAQEPARSEEQAVASGEAPETPAAVLFTVMAVVAGLVLVALAVAGLAYWLA